MNFELFSLKLLLFCIELSIKFDDLCFELVDLSIDFKLHFVLGLFVCVLCLFQVLFVFRNGVFHSVELLGLGIEILSDVLDEGFLLLYAGL